MLATYKMIGKMSKNHLKSPPAFSFFSEHCRPPRRITCRNHLSRVVLFQSIVGHCLVKSPNSVEIKKGKGIWREQLLTKQLLHLKKAGVSNRQSAKDLEIGRDKANEYVNRAENDTLCIEVRLLIYIPCCFWHSFKC